MQIELYNSNKLRFATEQSCLVGFYEYVKNITSNNAFYNSKAKKDRLTTLNIISIILSTNKTIGYLDCLSATGIRGIIINKVLKIKTILNDHKLNHLLHFNCKLNNISLEIHTKDAVTLLNSHNLKNYIVDIDSFGSAIPIISKIDTFDFEYLFLTFTDLINLCSEKHTEYIKKTYNCTFIKTHFKVENAIRMILQKLISDINKGVEVICCFSYHHYIRLFLKLKPKTNSNLNISQYYFCKICKYFSLDHFLVCEICYNIDIQCYGPVFCGSLISQDLQNLIIPTKRSVISLIDKTTNFMFGYSLDEIGKYLKCALPKTKFLLDKIISKGYFAYESWLDYKVIKTNMPYQELLCLVWDSNPGYKIESLEC